MEMVLIMVVIVWKDFWEKKSRKNLQEKVEKLNQNEETSLGYFETTNSQESVIYPNILREYTPSQKYMTDRSQEQKEPESLLEN